MKVRTLTAIIALLIFLPILLKGGLILMLFAFLLALIALKELLNMNMIKLLSCYLKMQVNGFKLSNLKV